MSEKEPTQPKLDEKTQQRLTDIDAELYVFKQKAKGDAKNNLKLVEMERAKELILEKRELTEEYIRPWDCNKEVTKSDWQNMMRELSRRRKDNRHHDFTTHAANMKIIDPSVNLEMRDSDWPLMDTELVTTSKGTNWFLFVWQARDMKIIKPERKLKITASDWDDIDKALAEAQDTNGREYIIRFASSIRILDPNKDYNKFVDKWQNMADAIGGREKSFSRDDYIEEASNVKIIDPKKKKFKITKEEWIKMNEKLDKCRKEHRWHNFATLASSMKILAAKSVKVTDQGLEIID